MSTRRWIYCRINSNSYATGLAVSKTYERIEQVSVTANSRGRCGLPSGFGLAAVNFTENRPSFCESPM